MRYILLQILFTGMVSLILLSGWCSRPALAASPLTGCWTITTAETTLKNQFYPPFQGSFLRATFPLHVINPLSDSTGNNALIIEDLNRTWSISLPAKCDSLQQNENIHVFRIIPPFAETDSLIVTSASTDPGSGFPIFRLVSQGELDHYLSFKPASIRSIESVPVFNRRVHANYNLDMHRFENFRLWTRTASADPLAAADFFKSVSFTIHVDGEELNLPLDAVLIHVDYEPGTAILKIQYLLNDDNILTLTACAPASYADPIFLIYVELTQHDGQSINITGHLELDRPDVAIINENLPDAPNLKRHITVFAHSAESIRIARRYCEIIASDPDLTLNRERDWWVNWHRLDRQPENLTSQQSELWTQSLTFLEINPLPMDSAQFFGNTLQRAWGLCLGGHADEANDELSLLLDESLESMTPVEWGQFLAVANVISKRIGHFQLIKSNWRWLLTGFSEPVISNFNAYLLADSLTVDQLYIFAGINALTEIADGLGVPASAYVYRRLSQQFATRLHAKLSTLDGTAWLNLLPGFQWLPLKSLLAHPSIYQAARLNGFIFGQEPTEISTKPYAIRRFLQVLAIGRLSGVPPESILASAYPIEIQTMINAHLFPKKWTQAGYAAGPDLSAELLTTYLLLLTNTQY